MKVYIHSATVVATQNFDSEAERKEFIDDYELDKDGIDYTCDGDTGLTVWMYGRTYSCFSDPFDIWNDIEERITEDAFDRTRFTDGDWDAISIPDDTVETEFIEDEDD